MHTRVLAAVIMAASCSMASVALAQDLPQAEASPVVTGSPVSTEPVTTENVPAPASVPNGTPIIVEITDLVSSKTAIRDDLFNLKLADPVTLSGVTVIPAGTPGKGQVIDVGKPGMGGKPGKLVLAARYLEFEGRQVPIRALNLDMTARDHSGAAVTTAVVGGLAGGVIGLVITGGNMEVHPGTRARAKLAADFTPVASPSPALQSHDEADPSSPAQTNTGTEPTSTPQTTQQ